MNPALTATTSENNNRGGQKGFSEAGRPTTSDQRSRLIVAFSEAFWMPASVNKIKKQKKSSEPVDEAR
jgi:hypothetical protein